MKFNCYFFTALMCCLFYTNTEAQQVPSDTLLNFLAMMSGVLYRSDGSLECDTNNPVKVYSIPIDIPALHPDYALYTFAKMNGNVVWEFLLSVGEIGPGRIRATPVTFREPRSNRGVFDEDFLTNLQSSDLRYKPPECNRFYTRESPAYFTGSVPSCRRSNTGRIPVFTNTRECNVVTMGRSEYRRCERYPLPSSWLEGTTFNDVCS